MKKKWIFLQGFALLTAIASCAISLAGCEVVSKPEPIAVESVTLDTESFTLELSYDRRLTATVTPYNADDKTVTWSSSNADVATVIDGRVISQGPGTATITARAGGKFATCTVTVRPQPVPVNSISLDNNNLTLGLDEKRKIVATVFPDDADDKTVTWRSENPSVATVDEDGTVTAIAEGYASIYAQAGEMGAYCTVIVKGKEEEGHIAVESVTLGTDTLTIEPGNTRKLTATVMPYNASDKTVIWTSSDETVATVNEYGMVTAIAPGTATITARAGDKEATCEVTVKLDTIPVESITINLEELTIKYDETGKLTATVMPYNASDKTVIWTSSDETVATVNSDGKVTPIDVGETRICAQAGDAKAYCQVYVYPIITLYTATLTISLGRGEGLWATVIPEKAADTVSIHWSSSDPAVADVPSSSSSFYDNQVLGYVSAKAPGTATITAEMWYDATGTCEATATCEVTVTTILVDSITLDATTLTVARTLAPSMARKLTATVKPDNADDKTVKWSSSDETVATVGDDGTITGLKAGTATITARAGDKTAKCDITVCANHSYSGGKCTVCGTKPYLEGGTIDENGYLTKYSGNEATVDIPDGVTYIWYEAFKDCTSLESVTIPGSVTGIWTSAFKGCTKLASIKIPGSVTSIGMDAFYGCSNLASVTIPDSVTSIESSAFEGCKSLASIKIPDGVTSIVNRTFYGCTSLAEVTISKSATSIGSYAFYGCTKLVYVDIPDSVTSIRFAAFADCTSLIFVNISDGVKDFGDNVFEGCTKLEGFKIPAGVTTISERMFYGCTILEKVIIPKSVTKIDNDAFSECDGLKTVEYGGTQSEWSKITVTINPDFGTGLKGKTITGSDKSQWTAKK